MITQAITDSLTSNRLDLSTVAGLFFLAFLAIYFFVAVKPGLDAKIRVNRQVRRRMENDRANQLYYEKTHKKEIAAFKAGGGTVPQSKSFTKKPYQRKNNGYYKNDKGYQAFLKHNAPHFSNKQMIKHNRFSKASMSKARFSPVK